MAQYGAIPSTSEHDKPKEGTMITLHVIAVNDGMLQHCWMWQASHGL